MNQELFNYFAHEHGISLLESDINEIENAVNSVMAKENTALKAVLAEVEKQTGQVREILRVAANNMAVLHHE